MTLFAVELLSGQIVDDVKALTPAEARDKVQTQAIDHDWPSKTVVATYTYTVDGRRSNRRGTRKPNVIDQHL